MTQNTSTAPEAQSYVAYTDGACHGNPGPGAWAYHLQNPDGTFTDAAGFIRGETTTDAAGFPHEDTTTNNRAELFATINALEAVPPGARIHIFSDSGYVIGGPNGWIADWKKQGWKNAKKKPVKNKDLWLRLDALTETREATFEWVKGHAGHPENERADELARAGMAPFKP